VFKEYQFQDSQKPWEKEVNIFNLVNNTCENLVRQLGSFSQNDKFVIVLEYANGGTLLDIFQANHLPRNLTRMKEFWRNLMRLLFALDKLHSLRISKDGRLGWYARTPEAPLQTLSFA
jgi:serine/threonine protein kinase